MESSPDPDERAAPHSVATTSDAEEAIPCHLTAVDRISGTGSNETS